MYCHPDKTRKFGCRWVAIMAYGRWIFFSIILMNLDSPFSYDLCIDPTTRSAICTFLL